MSRDYVGIACAFAHHALKDKKTTGKYIRLAAKRFLSDLKCSRKPWVFSEPHAVQACAFIECLPHIEGEWESPNITLHPAHVFMIVQTFGFRRRSDGHRRFTTVVYASGRKSAKSTIASGIGLYCLAVEGGNGPQVVSAATTGAQARIVWSVAKKMVEKEHDLREYYNVEPFANSIACWSNGGSFRPINAKASTQDGLNPSCVILDELHAHKNHDLLNVLRSAAGGRAAPLFLYLTTEGYETPGPWPEEREFGKKLLEGAVKADHVLFLYFAVDDEDDDFDETAWKKANPLWDVNPYLVAEIKKAREEAKAKPGAAAEYRIKRLNRPSSAADTAIDLRRWNRCKGIVDIEALRGVPCWAAIDLASTRDMCSIAIVWRLPDGRALTHVEYFVPDSAVAQRTDRNTVPYAAWVEAGLITQTEGDCTDYRVIEERIRWWNEYGVTEWAYDPWNATDLVNRLTEDDIPMIAFRQGAQSYNSAWGELERLYLAGLLEHGGNPVLRWNASNLVLRQDENENKTPSKKRSSDKIDGICCVMMALGISQAADKRSVYETRGVLEL